VEMLSNEMKRLGHQVKVLTRLNRDSLNDPDVIQISRPGGELRGYGTWAAKAWLKAQGIEHDLVHFHGFDGQILSVFPFVTRSPRILHIHNSLSVEPEWFHHDPVRHRVGYYLAARSFRRADRVIAPTETVKRDLLWHVPTIRPDNIRVAPNFVDTRLYSPRGKAQEFMETHSLDGKFVILYFGKIKRTKGIEDLCKAFSILKTKMNAALIVAGGGTATDTFLNYLRATYKDVIFTGFVKDPRLIYAAANAFVIYTPGVHGGEVFPIALLEAMSMGLPVVCADSPIFREVTKGNAIFVKPNSPESLADSIIKLAKSNNCDQLGKTNRTITQDLYDVRKVVSQVEGIYEEIANTG